MAKRFALVPMGPPLVRYSSTTKSMFVYNKNTNGGGTCLLNAPPPPCSCTLCSSQA